MLTRHSVIGILILVFSSLTCQVFALETDVDARLEKQLDDYIELIQTDMPAGEVLIAKLTNSEINNPALQSRARLLGYLTTNAFYDKKPDLSEHFLRQLLAIAEHTDQPNILSEIYATELELLIYKQRSNEAILKADLAEALVEKATDPRIKYFAHNVLGRIYNNDGQYAKALEHFISSLDAVAETNDSGTIRRRTFLSFNIAQVHAELKNWSQARQITEQLIEDVKKYQHINFLPELYLLWGYIADSEQSFSEAINIYEQGLEIALNKDLHSMALTFENNLGATYIKLHQYPAAEKVLLIALQRAKQLEDEYSQHLIQFNLAYTRVLNGEHEVGIEQLNIHLHYFQQNSTKAQFEPYLEWLAKAYAVAGLYEKQAKTLLKQMTMREEIRATEQSSRLNELQNRYDNKAKAQRIIILEQENNLKAQLLKNKQLQQILTLLFVIAMFFAGIALLYLYRKVRKSNRKLYETNKKLAMQSQKDPLTGLYNRRALFEHMQGRSKRRRDNDTPVNLTGILMLDIDFFKRVNDHYGHSAGDAVLIELSQRLQLSCREQDLVVRWGGEEILLLLDNVSLEQVPGFIQRILNIIAEIPMQYEKHKINITVSGGFIHLPFADVSEQQLSWEKVMQIADMALYLSKANGRNQVCMINGLTVSFEQAEALLYTDLASAIRQNMLDVATISGPGGNVS